MAESLNIPHLQTDDSLVTFYCVRRMPNGKLATARVTATATGFDCVAHDSKKLFAEMVIGDLKAALELLPV